jgi:hypothetical protein
VLWVCEAAKKQLETEGKLSESKLEAAPTADMQPQLASPSATPEPEPEQVTASPSVQSSPAARGAVVNPTSSSASDVADVKADTTELKAKMAEMTIALERIETKSTTCSLM